MPTETDLPTRCTKDRASTRAKESREFGEESTVFLRKGIHYTESTEKDVFSVSSRNVSDVQETKVVAHGEDDCPWDKPGLTENKTPTTPIARASARPKDSREDILNCLLRSSCSPAELTVPQEKHATIPSRTPTPNSIRERLRGTGVFEYREFSGDAALPIPSRDQDNMYSDREPGENSHRRDSEPHTSEARSGPGKASRLNPYHAPSLDKGAQNNITRDVQERQLQKAAHHPRALPAHQYRMAAIDSKPGYLVDTLPRDREEHCFFQDQVYLEFDANRCQGSDVMQNVGDIGKGSMGQRVNAPNPLQRGMSQDQTQHTNRLFQDSTASPNRFFTFPGNLPTVQPLARGYTPTYRQYEAAQAPRGLPSEAEVRQDYMYTLSADSPNLFANLTETIDDVTRNQREGGAREDIHDFIVRNEMELLGTDDLESPWDDSVAYGQPVSSHQLSAPYHEPAIIGYEPSYRNVSSQNRENHPSLCGRIPEYEAQSLGLYRGLGDGMREHNNPVSDRHSRFLEVDMGSFWKPRFY
ncbi:hypothetical protein B0I35DRAFT_31388 [Stachybotrys elegans]|uniref:Uncharacterized protein n=1 Tax=Stachybotrys elegans TaxID=80388 RepID=A0A8K0T867_9HYPO|nr:hypothetical protein B0I35DRAFT_31388 [Stachybotrys elegans]